MKIILGSRSAMKGQVIILFALVLVVLLGVAALVLDLGLCYLEKSRMQNVVDTAALLAVRILPDTVAAQNEVSAIAQANGYVLGQNGVVAIEVVPNPDGQHRSRYAVRMRKQMPSFLSVILGHQWTLLQAYALADCFVEGIVPWMFYLPDIPNFNKGTQYTLKEGPFGAQFGNFGSLRLSGGGAKEYQDDIINGYDGFISLGQELQTQPGNMSGPTRMAVNQRIRNGGLTIVCPVTSDAVPQGASSTLTVEGFAIFTLNSVYMQSGECIVVATFVGFVDSPGPIGNARLIG